MSGLQPGTVVGDQRYVTVRALFDHGDAEVWQAQDNSLEELVTLVVVPMSSPTALAVLDAASRSAGLNNPRLVRVLDVGREYDYGYFVEESLDGAVTMTQLAAGVGMEADEVRRMTGETALALDAAQRRGLHHLGLTPDNVVRMPDGSVKLAGLATQAALVGQDHVGGKRALRRDAKGLVALAYAGLTGRWPFPGDVGLPPAPKVVSGVPRPSEIAVGVPNDLDTICQLTLNQDLGPISPGDYAAQIAPWPDLQAPEQAALAIPAGSVEDYLAASPLASDAPASDAAASDPAAAVTQALPVPAGDAVGQTRWLPSDDDAARRDAADARSAASDPDGGAAAAEFGGEGGASATTAAVGGAGGSAAGMAAGASSAAGAGGAATGAGTAAGAAGAAAGVGAAAGASAALSGALGSAGKAGRKLAGRLRQGASSMGAAARSATARAEGAVAEKRELKAAIRRVEADSEVTIDQTPQQPVLEPPVPLLPPESGAQPSRAQSRFVLASFAAATLAAGLVAGAVAFRPPQSDLEAILGSDATAPVSTATSSQSASPTSEASAAPGTGEQLAIVGATGYDPEGDNVEYNDLAARVYDEDKASFWQSEGYQGPKFGGLKSGVGLIVDFGQDVTPKQITLTLPNPSDLELYLGTSPDRAGANRIGTVSGEQGDVTLDVTDGAAGRYLIVWFTDSPLVSDGRYRAMLAEVSATG